MHENNCEELVDNNNEQQRTIYRSLTLFIQILVTTPATTVVMRKVVNRALPERPRNSIVIKFVMHRYFTENKQIIPGIINEHPIPSPHQ